LLLEGSDPAVLDQWSRRISDAIRKHVGADTGK